MKEKEEKEARIEINNDRKKEGTTARLPAIPPPTVGPNTELSERAEDSVGE